MASDEDIEEAKEMSFQHGKWWIRFAWGRFVLGVGWYDLSACEINPEELKDSKGDEGGTSIEKFCAALRVVVGKAPPEEPKG